MRKKILKQTHKQLVQMIEIFDEMNAHNSSIDTQEKMTNPAFQYLSQQTITNCSNIISNNQEFGIDEKIKAKMLSRLVREYRRSLEQKQRLMVAEQKEREIEFQMKQRFPNLMSNDKGAESGDQKRLNKQQVKYYQETAERGARVQLQRIDEQNEYANKIQAARGRSKGSRVSSKSRSPARRPIGKNSKSRSGKKKSRVRRSDSFDFNDEADYGVNYVDYGAQS